MTAREKIFDALDTTKVTPDEFLNGAIEYIAEYALYQMKETGKNTVFWKLKTEDDAIVMVDVTRTQHECKTDS